MKRIIAIILAAVLILALLPLGLLVKAESVTKKAFYTLNGSELWKPESNVITRAKFLSPTITKDYTYLVSAYGSKDVKVIAQKTKEDFDSRPEGTRYILLQLMTKAVHGLVEKNVYFDEAEKAIKGWVEEFLAEYHRIGGKLDGITLDLEYIYSSAWYIHLGARNSNDDSRYNNPNLFFDIVEDPRYKTQIRPRLEELGFPFETPSSTKTEIHGIDKQNSTAYNIWNRVMASRESELIDRCVYAPLQKYYPNANTTDYQVGYNYGWQKAVRDGAASVTGNRLGCGETSSFNCYAARPSNTMSGYTSKNEPAANPSYTTPAACNDSYYELTAFNRILWDINMLKTMAEATPGGRISTHITFFNYAPTKIGTYSNTPYYAEDILHIGLMDPKPFMGYIIEDEVFNKGQSFSDPNMEDYGYAIKVVNDIMVELTRVAGASDRKPIPVPATWNSKFILSGMYAGGRNIWRITPDTSTGVTLEQFLVKDKAPTFYIDGQTVTFPQGRIIEDGNVRQVGTCGYWVETPANVMPVITNDTNRYSQYSPLMDTFENYQEGTKLSKTTALPHGTWNVSGSATVKTVNGNKVLEMTGASTIKSVKLPANITAGDSYARQQAWEATVTLPQKGKMRLLTYSDVDRGLRIEEGKAYYYEGSLQKEIPNVTLTPGATYTFKREVDFRKTGSFRNSFYIYDAAGKLLGSATDVPMTVTELPIQEIGLHTTGADAAYIDNFKAYPVGVTTELEAYDAASGDKVGLDVLNKKDAAYRLSWMNASSEYKVAKIYNGTTLLEEIKMAPGQDGVNTAIVKGSNIKFSVKVEDATAPNATNYDNGDFNWTAVASSIGLATGKVGTNSGNPGTTIPTPTEPDGTPSPTYPDGKPVPAPTNPDGTPSETYPDGTPAPNNSGNKTGSNTGLWIAIIIGVVLIVVVVTFAVLYFVVKPKWLLNLLEGKENK